MAVIEQIVTILILIWEENDNIKLIYAYDINI